MFNPLVNIFPNVNALQAPLASQAVLDVLNDIKNGTYKDVVRNVRSVLNHSDKKIYQKAKAGLPAITFSGEFAPTIIEKGKNQGKTSHRSDAGLIEFSGIILYDLDNLTKADLSLYSDKLRADPYVFAFFVSPSGAGLKVLFRTSEPHATAWPAVNEYLANQYQLPIDPSGKDISRLCFVSYDPDLHLKQGSILIDGAFVNTCSPKSTEPPKPKNQAQEAPKNYLAKCHQIVQRTCQPIEGSRNRYAGQFAQQANRYGIPMNEAFDELANTLPDYPKDELAKTIEHHYNAEAAEAGKYLTNTESKARPKKPTGTNITEVDESVLFWYSFKKKGEDNEGYALSYDNTINFLQNNGFFKYRLAGGFYQFIKLEKGGSVIDTVTELTAKEFILDYLKSSNDNEFRQVRELFRRSKSICATANLEGLDYHSVNLRRDTKDVANLYFPNCYLEIKAESITVKNYSSLSGTIWKKHVIDFDFVQQDWQGCDAATFLQRAITGEKDPEKLDATQTRKLQSLHTTIGYLLHGYKDPTLTKAVVAVDQVLRRGKENEGRTGKSLLCKMIDKVINTVTLDGRNFSLDKPFALQKIEPDTRLVNLNDAKKNMDFTRFFGMITEDLDYEKKNMNVLTMSYHDSPKWYISMNNSLQGDGSSVRDRQHIIEFTNYYSDKLKPIHEFKREFFDGWDTLEWQRFYSFMAYCLQLFLLESLLPFPLENYDINKLIDGAGEDFVDFMDEQVLAALPGRPEHSATELYGAFVKEIPEKFRPKINTFSANVKKWCDANGILLNPAKAGRRDRRNGVTYFTFAFEDDSRNTQVIEQTIAQSLTDPEADLPF